MPFIEHGYACDLGLLPHEIAQTCASHSSTDLHAQTVDGILHKFGMDEANLQCGVHPPMDKATNTRLMQVGGGKFAVKGGAEGYQALGILPDLAESCHKGVGIALKIFAGDAKENVRVAGMQAILQQLGYLSAEERRELSEFAPVQTIYTWRKPMKQTGS